MANPFEQPTYQATAFNCPMCNAYAHMTWSQLGQMIGNSFTTAPMQMATCGRCKQASFWHIRMAAGGRSMTGVLVWPLALSAPLPNADMPEDVRCDYEEARNVAPKSPRAGAALLRLAIQRLCRDLGKSGENLNQDIGEMVAEGLHPTIQKALDVVRVTGNNAVHPGVLSDEDLAETSNHLFGLVNAIVDDRITRPKVVEELYERLPATARDAITRRDESSK